MIGFDAEGHVYCKVDRGTKRSWSLLYELTPDGMIERFDWGYPYLQSPLFISLNECWAGTTMGLCCIDPEAGTREYPNRDELIEWDSYIFPSTMDHRGVLWFAWGPSLGTYYRQVFSVFLEGDWQGAMYGKPVLDAVGTVWSVEYHSDASSAVVQCAGNEVTRYTVEDGLPAYPCGRPAIDYDGRVWFFNANDDGITGLSRISDGGWPPMRLMLHEVETEGTIALEAQVINNGPVVGVDVYIAIELHGQLLYWPNWQPEPYANQINLRPGHNQTATIVEARKEDIPPGSYTFWGCMTGRNTSKLIGPIDRKFESLTVRVD